MVSSIPPPWPELFCMALDGPYDIMGGSFISAAGCQTLLQAPTASCFPSLQEVALRSLPVRGAVGDRNGEEVYCRTA